MWKYCWEKQNRSTAALHLECICAKRHLMESLNQAFYAKLVVIMCCHDAMIRLYAFLVDMFITAN